VNNVHNPPFCRQLQRSSNVDCRFLLETVATPGLAAQQKTVMPTQIDNHNAEVKVRRYSGSAACDVIVRKRGKEMVLGCRDYDQAVKWARIECKTYGVSAVSVERAGKGGIGTRQ
jgi:hypothetical protein